MSRKSAVGKLAYRDKPLEHRYPVKSAWKRLKRFSCDCLPQIQQDDAEPVTTEEVAEFEENFFKLPKDLRASFLVHNGQCAGPGIVYGLEVHSIEECLRHWQSWVFGYDEEDSANLDAACSSFPVGCVQPVYFDRGWIPVTYDSGGNHIAIDLNPGPKGKRGQVIVFGRDDKFHCVLAHSWGQLLTDLADEYEAGNYRLNTENPDYPEFDCDDPHSSHFHSIGIYWSRAKLGLRNLSRHDRKLWKHYHGE